MDVVSSDFAVGPPLDALRSDGDVPCGVLPDTSLTLQALDPRAPERRGRDKPLWEESRKRRQWSLQEVYRQLLGSTVRGS